MLLIFVFLHIFTFLQLNLSPKEQIRTTGCTYMRLIWTVEHILSPSKMFLGRKMDQNKKMISSNILLLIMASTSWFNRFCNSAKNID